MALPERLNFGIFLAPFHPLGENIKLAHDRDLELVQWLDYLGYDECWVGEHHSAGWETIPAPDIFMAVAAERTRNLRFGTGVYSLPYHHPFIVAHRMSLLDNLTNGRIMLGVGPGAMVTDAYMLGQDYGLARGKMDEALGVILRLFTETEPVTHVSDWFELHDAMLQIKPFQKPHMPIAVASAASPAGVAVAGKHGVAVLSASVPADIRGQPALQHLWQIAEDAAAEHGKTVRREDWRLSIPVHLAESKKQAMDEARMGAGRQLREYTEVLLGPNPVAKGPVEEVIDRMVDAGSWIVGTPDDCIAGIKRLNERSGGFGSFLVQHHEWVSREKRMHSFDLLARYVMPEFQGSLQSVKMSYDWGVDHLQEMLDLRHAATDKARKMWDEAHPSR
jgi:limonene 1,2-monooxygenase